MISFSIKVFFSSGCVHTWCRALVPGHRQKIVLRSDAGTPSIQVQCRSKQVQVETLYPGTGIVPEFWCEYLEEGVFTLVPSENRIRAPCSAPSVNTALEQRRDFQESKN